MKLVVCFISPRQRLGDIKTHNSFHKYRMKGKLISDPIHVKSYIMTILRSNCLNILKLYFTKESPTICVLAIQVI